MKTLFQYVEIIFFFIFFSIISFLPEPISGQYRIFILIFLGIFFLINIINNNNLFILQDWPVWLFLICLFAGTVSAIDKNAALSEYYYLAITFFLLFYIGKNIFFSNSKTISLIICACGCLVAIIGIIELYFGKNILYENFISNPYYERYIKFYPRPMSTQLNPAILGSYLLGCLPFSFYFFKNKSLRLRITGLITSLLCITVILLTFSRGVFLGLIFMISFYLWLSKKKKIVFLLFSFLVIFILICSFQKDSNLNRFGFKRMISGSYDSVISEYRLNRVKMSLKIFKDYPLFGIGFNNFRIRFNEYCSKEDIGELYEFMIPDNMYLTFISETGIIGTLGFLIFLFLLLRNGIKQINTLKDTRQKQMLLIPLSAFIGLLVNMGAYELFYWNNPYMFFCLLCGFIHGSTKKIIKCD